MGSRLWTKAQRKKRLVTKMKGIRKDFVEEVATDLQIKSNTDFFTLDSKIVGLACLYFLCDITFFDIHCFAIQLISESVAIFLLFFIN